MEKTSGGGNSKILEKNRESNKEEWSNKQQALAPGLTRPLAEVVGVCSRFVVSMMRI